MGKLRLYEHPYTYARVCAMKSKLINRDQYNRLLKMKVHEILKFLQETTYKPEIDELAISHAGPGEIETVLNKNMVRTLNKLKRISDGNLAVVIGKYLQRYDVYNIKTILRGLFTKSNPEKIENMLLTVGELKKAVLLNLLKKESVEEGIGMVQKLLPDLDAKKALAGYKEKNNLFEIENVLDHYYYNNLLAFTENIAGQGELFKTFLLHEIDILNIKTILRLKREKVESQEIEKYLFFSGARLNKTILHKLVKMDDIGMIIERVKREGYSKSLSGDDFDNASLIDIENHLKHYLLQRANLLMHQHTLTINVILGYLLAKEIETRNLKVLVKGKKLSLNEAFLEREIVVAK
jgi:V/A-type H+/Na+-transporting ATPase subunit C